MSVHEKALKGIFDDMDDFESKKMFGDTESPESKGASITITISPNGDTDFSGLPSDHEEDMCKGGCAMHKGGTVPTPELEADIHSGYDKGRDPMYEKGEMGMSDGGVVQPEAEDLTLPPFLRKKKRMPGE